MKSKPASTTNPIFQLKITLIESKPPIWRRIQVANCTLNELHQYIQSAMGWSNTHLHQFEIGRKRFSDPGMNDGSEDMESLDSNEFKLTDILPKSGKPFAFVYEYDFGDSWRHEIEFEKIIEPEAGVKYPICVDGARACPPEDVGGVWGFQDFLEAIADPIHERHDELTEWSGEFDPTKFDKNKTTKSMHEGVPNWNEGW